ncbi:cytidine/deoxycytidylate deaminase-like protein [Neolewinella xylanilytica]|uniref:Cytidine/deoxycytidylate deaminase-like protein n=1 Tax=Neolewinella xylanilytica TaxID=1514080 RepID=A0A2S6I6Y6_9BACT|nr:nucleoside deaminase [Neolewinella xylanilytica]PPK87245.1 cytidine/deoxycytidylate deaminase-like protein [Neolewinella xylanilytica]
MNLPLSDPIATERDILFSLLAYSVVYRYWEPIDRGGRGYNVGCILVDTADRVVDYALNHVSQQENATQHGEVRLMTGYLDRPGIYALEGHTIYSTLEPCAMCAGMMTMVSIDRTVNGQPDYYFSKALERLSFDSQSIGGYAPYPRTVTSVVTPAAYSQQLDDAYHQYIREGNAPIITRFLTTEVARRIFERATRDFQNFGVAHPENEIIYKNALNFFRTLPEHPK